MTDFGEVHFSLPLRLGDVPHDGSLLFLDETGHVTVDASAGPCAGIYRGVEQPCCVTVEARRLFKAREPQPLKTVLDIDVPEPGPGFGPPPLKENAPLPPRSSGLFYSWWTFVAAALLWLGLVVLLFFVL